VREFDLVGDSVREFDKERDLDREIERDGLAELVLD